MADVAERTAFLVGADGVVRNAWRYDEGELPEFDELVEGARALRTATSTPGWVERKTDR
jgi:hypothetical protein